MPRTFRLWPRGVFWGALMIVVAALAGIAEWRDRNRDASAESLAYLEGYPPHEGDCVIRECIGGDLLLVAQRSEPDNPQAGTALFRVRLLGVNVPAEFEHRARSRLAELISGGEATLELDKRRSDRDGHLLAYVYVADKLLAAELVRAGVARFDPYPGDDMAIARLLGEAQDAARRERRGIWAAADE